MISDRRRAWLKDKIHGYLVKKFPNLVRLADLLKEPAKKQVEHLLDDNFHTRLNRFARKAFPFFLAYFAGFVAPTDENHLNRKTARSS